MTIRLALLWCLLTLLAPLAGAAELRLFGDESTVPLSPLLTVFEDKSAAMGIDEVVRLNRFETQPELLRPGHTRSAIWLRLDVANVSEAPLTRWIEVQAVQIREVSLFQRHGGQWQRSEAGANQPFLNKPVATANAVFPLQLAAHERETVYLRLASPLPITIAPALWEPLAFRTGESRTRLLDGGMLGGLVVMALLGLLLLVTFRDRAFLFNALATATYFFGESSSKGYSFMYLWPEATDWVMRGMPMYALLGVGFHLLFLRDLLVTQRNFPRIDRLLLVLLVAEWLPAPGILLGNAEFWARLSSPQHFPVTVVMALIGIYAASKGVRAARYYTAGYVVLALGSLVQGLAQAGFDIPHDLSRYALPIGMLINNLFLLTSVVERIMVAIKEKDAAKSALLAARAAHEAELEAAVEARTADLNAALAETQQSQRSQHRLLAYIGHDLRAPLATIVNYVRLLGQHGDAEVHRYQDTIERSALHQLELIDELVEYSRGELKHLELLPLPTYLYDWLDNVAAQAELLAGQYGNHFTLDAGELLPPVLVFDPKRLRQVLLNLLANAAKFTCDGAIRLVVHAEATSANKLELTFAVEDNGSGIAAEEMQRIFMPFERRKSEREGYGLGLSIARQLVQAMGGELTATSTPGQGSRFAFSLRLDTASEAEVLPTVQAFVFPPPFGAGKTLLVVDDNAASRDYLQEILTHADFTVVCASNGSDALQLAREGHFDAMLVDQIMPGLDGWGVLRKLHEEVPGCVPPVVLCSALPPQRPTGFPAGIDFHSTLLKPVGADKLLQTMQALFSRSVSPGLSRPPATLLVPLRQLVAAGHITDIEEWASALTMQHPEFADFARRVEAAALRIDFDALAMLLSE